MFTFQFCYYYHHSFDSSLVFHELGKIVDQLECSSTNNEIFEKSTLA